MIWQDVDIDLLESWRAVFIKEYKGGVDLSLECPICKKKELHRYYHIYRKGEKVINGLKYVGEGGLWQWCSSCGNYEHYSAAVPEWWECDFKVDESELTTTPESIEKARLAVSCPTDIPPDIPK